VLFLHIWSLGHRESDYLSESDGESEEFRERFESMRQSVMWSNLECLNEGDKCVLKSESEESFESERESDCAPICESIVVETQSEESEESDYFFEDSIDKSEWLRALALRVTAIASGVS